MQETFKLFANMLDERFSSKAFTTEDSIRYTFFLALHIRNVWKHTDIVLEHPHQTKTGAEIDVLIGSRGDMPSMAVEFKYDRRIASGKNQPRTQKVGAMFNDIFRLAHVPKIQAVTKYFIYVTDSEMASYFRNPANGFRDFFALPISQSFRLDTSFAKSRAATFQSRLTVEVVDCTVICSLARELNGGNSLRIYEIIA
jgi:hypothetical protein